MKRGGLKRGKDFGTDVETDSGLEVDIGESDGDL